MPCPHGCTPAAGLLSDADTLQLMIDAFEAGGNDDPALREMLVRCLDDPVAARLMSRYMRGDRTIAAELARRLQTNTTTRFGNE
ncbi:hypothetical protein WIS52_20480 [Pseudonocardia nematodicida]|uniref:Uncharacterized protein n=1 Tax=Pseudonocardia nematodicida TaxID=1206997 RepID=A0ABV1KEF6_9PSEU